MTFSEVFGGNVLLPANNSFLDLAMAADVELRWPLEQQFGDQNVVSDIIRVNASLAGLNLDMPDATLTSEGMTSILDNTGPNTVIVRDAANNTLISLASGTCWVLYVADNSTVAGTWRVFQLGASVSSANAAGLAGSGLKAIGATLNTTLPVSTKAGTPYNILNSDRGVLLNWTSGVGTFNLPAAGTVGSDWFCAIRNSGTGDLTVTPPSGTIDGAATKTFQAGSSGFVVTDGVNFFTVGFGGGGTSGGSSGFDFLTINVAGTGNYTLAGAELGKIGYRFTGVLTGTRTIVVPGSTDEYWVDNQTTGAFSLYLKTAAQAAPGVLVPQGTKAILYCDGADVVSATSSAVTFPITIAQGGTGATTAPAALTALGGSATGVNVFTATSQANAQTALGISAVAQTLLTQTTQALMRTTGLGFSAFFDTLVASASATAARATLGAAPSATTITGTNSITGGGDLSANRTLQLSGDAASPGNWAIYGVSGTGVKGWQTSSFRPQFGGLGVGVAAPASANDILCIGNINASYTSDVRFKQNVHRITDALEKVIAMRGVEFDWTPEYLESKGGEHPYFLPKHHAGFVAQEVESIWPVCVRTRSDGVKALNHDLIIPLILEAVKELFDRLPPNGQ